MIQYFDLFMFIGATSTGLILFYAREKVDPVQMIGLSCLYSLIGDILLILVNDSTPETLLIAIFALNAMSWTTALVSSASYCLEEWGAQGFAWTFCLMTSFSALGYFIANELLFSYFYETFFDNSTDRHGKLITYYNVWHVYLGYVFIGCSVFTLLMTYFAHAKFY